MPVLFLSQQRSALLLTAQDSPQADTAHSVFLLSAALAVYASQLYPFLQPVLLSPCRLIGACSLSQRAFH